MNEKQQILDDLVKIFKQWQVLLASLSYAQILAPMAPSSWTIKDLVAHLWSWQQASVARAVAALSGQQPRYPAWWEQCGPDPEEDVDATNSLLYSLSKDKSWTQVYTAWKAQFTRYLELTRQVPEKDFLQPGRYTWMGKWALADSTKGSLSHHQEHYEMLTAWLRDRPGMQSLG
jgi:hypothetical protein